MKQKKITDYYYTVITNLENRTAYEIIKGRDSDTVTSYLRELPDRGNVKVICHDLADSYQKVSKALSETAIDVVDKYHIIALLQDAVNEARKKESRRLEVGEEAEREKEIKEVGLAKTPKYEGLEANAKKDYRLIRAPRKTLPQSARERVDAYLSLMPEVKKVHRLRDDFMLLYKAKSPASAAKSLERWEKNALTADSVYLQKFLTELKSCRELFLNYFISDVRAHLSSREEHMRDVSTQPKELERSDPISGAVTNGYAEGLNRQINYLVFISPNISFRVLRLKILLLHGGACDEEREGRPLELARKSFRKSEQRKEILALSWSR